MEETYFGYMTSVRTVSEAIARRSRALREIYIVAMNIIFSGSIRLYQKAALEYLKTVLQGTSGLKRARNR